MVAHRLVGSRYIALLPETSGGRPSEGIGLKLVLWVGAFANVRQSWLRWATREREPIPIPVQAAEQAEGQAAAAETRALQKRVRATEATARTTQAEMRAATAELEHRRLQDLLRSLGYTAPPE